LVSCNKGKDLTEEEIYTIFNEIIVDDSLNLGTVYVEFEDLYLADNYKPNFSKNDIEFIYRQKSLFSSMKIAPNKLKKYYWKKIRKGTSPYLDIQQNITDGVINQFSFPIISIDRKTVLISINSVGNCMLCGGGGKYLYKKINNHWKRVETYDEWIS
jgi:hypothetical protein